MSRKADASPPRPLALHVVCQGRQANQHDGRLARAAARRALGDVSSPNVRPQYREVDVGVGNQIEVASIEIEKNRGDNVAGLTVAESAVAQLGQIRCRQAFAQCHDLRREAKGSRRLRIGCLDRTGLGDFLLAT